MIEFQDVEDEALIFRHSLFVSATYKVIHYCAQYGGIGLTVKKNFNRKFVDWAVDAFQWRGYTREDMYMVNKVLNEIDLPPLGFIHEMLIALKIGRHYKGQFKLTRQGNALAEDITGLFNLVAIALVAVNSITTLNSVILQVWRVTKIRITI